MSGCVTGGVGSGSGSGGSALGGLGGSLEDKDSSLLCPVCFELIQEAYVTRCGHSFCFSCVTRAVDLQRRCPRCGAALTSRDQLFPNLLLNELVARRRAEPTAAPSSPPASDSAELLTRQLSAPELDRLLDTLTRRRRALEAESRAAHRRLLLDFLRELHRSRSAQLTQVAREAELVRRDMQYVEEQLRELPDPPAPLSDEPPSTPAVPPPPTTDEFSSPVESGGDPLSQRWRRLHAHFDDFVQCYFSHRADELYFPEEESSAPAVPEREEAGAGGGGEEDDQRAPERPPPRDTTRPADPHRGLDAFREELVSFTRYRALRPLATLSYSSDAINYSTIVSTIEFDKDAEFFAIAGVTKRIKVYEYAAVTREGHEGGAYPCGEMQCGHKVSCVSWNAYHKNVLASADYEGAVSVWDAAAGRRTRALHEHDKRCWSVHFSRGDVRLLASGSDDARVKLWALNVERSVATLEAKFNVCCVRFNPRSSCHLAFGSADHCVHYYDLRAPRVPLAVLRDHRKAVSYVKFLDADSLVSASTDSALKLWRVDRPRPVRSFTGHANEKNFVGLATDGRYVACGSENNALYVYSAGLARPLLAYRFEAVRGFLERPARDEEHADFVSAVCWKRGSDVLLAANSQGLVKVLQLV